MAIKIFSIDTDEVINSLFLTGKTTYEFALNHFVPLVDRLDIQRKGQNPKFYKRLEDDIIRGCIMPSITLAFVGLDIASGISKTSAEQIITERIEDAFILDGLQRMRTLQRVQKRESDEFDASRPIFVNILLCESMDKLLYRMITLNNGQKPMTARHQIEIIASNVYDFSSSSLTIKTEKDLSKKQIPGAFKQADFIKAYLAFLSNSTNIDNSKIIEEKMDELIADKILDIDIKERRLEFTSVVDLIANFTDSSVYLKKWFQSANNLIGFCSSIAESYATISTTADEFEDYIRVFEEAFEYFDVSKIKVGDVRRKTVSYFISHFEELSYLDSSELIDRLSQQI